MSNKSIPSHRFKEKSSNSLKITKMNEFGFVRKRLQSTVGYRSVIFMNSNPSDVLYFEVQTISDGFIRVGIATEEVEINGPIGIDNYGYSIGTKNGYLFYESKRTLFGERILKNSIISCLFWQENRKLIFFVDGQRIGKEITHIKEGLYFPAVSVFKKAQVDVFLDQKTQVFQDKIFKEYNIKCRSKS
jgi:hypothetical protein